MKIRKLQEADIRQALELCDEAREHHREVLGGYFAPIDEAFEMQELLRMIEDEKLLCLVAEDEKNLLGLLVAEWKTSPFLENPKVAHIHNFVVSKASRGQGVGHLLMDEFMLECRKRGADEIKLGVFNANEVAYRFYENYGFKPLEQRMNLKLK